MAEEHPICLLHIGKTGGTYLRSLLRYNSGRWTKPLKLLRHSATLVNTAENFGDDRKLAFTFRDPTERFVSAFYSRMRQGRPTYQFNWSAAEAAAYLWFESAEDLALALICDDERRKSAAIFAFDAIAHLKSNLAAFLHSARHLTLNQDQIVMCVDVADLDAKLPAVMNRLGVRDFKMPTNPKRHASPAPLPPLSAEAEAALRSFWAEEYALYDACREVAESLGLGNGGSYRLSPPAKSGWSSAAKP